MDSAPKQPFELLPMFRERVWGRRDLPDCFAQSPVTEPIGEVWYTFSGNGTALGKNLREVLRSYPAILGNAAQADYPDLCPLLIKLLFTTERLSIQVHPDDAYAAKHHGCLGKTEAWYVMDAKPPGEVAIGFREPISPERLEAAVKSGELENLLDWRKVHPGDVIFTPAGTVHAIGAGLTICEIQQNSDITYRLYDYGRPRELHLDHGIRVAKGAPHEHRSEPIRINETRVSLLRCEYFHIERLHPVKPIRIAGQSFYSLLICLGGLGKINGEPFAPGRAWFVPASSNGFEIEGPGSEWILTYTAHEAIQDLSVSQ